MILLESYRTVLFEKTIKRDDLEFIPMYTNGPQLFDMEI